MSKLANSQMVKVYVRTCVFMRACVSVRACGFCVPRARACVCFAGDCRTLCSGCQVSLREGVHGTNRFVREIWSPGAGAKVRTSLLI